MLDPHDDDRLNSERDWLIDEGHELTSIFEERRICFGFPDLGFGAAADTITVTIAQGTDTHVFARLKVTIAP